MKRISGLFVFFALLFTAFGAGVRAEEKVGYFYVNSERGNDRASGLDAANAVKTLAQVWRIAEKSGADRAYIVFTNACTASSTVSETVHSVPFVLTTRDAETDYAEEGAKLVFGKGLRYILNGDTSFENLPIEYSGTLNFVAQYHSIAFGEGVTHTRLDGEESGVYVVGGFQSPGASVRTDLDSHVTIASGSFAYVVGGSRQSAGGADLTFTGTHRVTVSGGEIAALYAGSLSKHTSGSAEIRVTGGRIRSLFFAGDNERALNGNADAVFSGGEIETVFVNNVIGDVGVTLSGAGVGEMAVSYYNGTIEAAHKAAGGAARLVYRGSYSAAIGRYTGFSSVQNETTYYAKEGANGRGLSESDPASFAAAVKAAAESGGAVKILGRIGLGDFSEPAHGEPLVVTGASSDALLQVSGVYTLGGETRFESLEIAGGTFDARKGRFIAAESLRVSAGGEPLLLGGADLSGGTFSGIREAGTVVMTGGEVTGELVGGGEETHLTLDRKSVV